MVATYRSASGQHELTRTCAFWHAQFNGSYTQFLGGRQGWRGAAFLNYERTGLQIIQIKLELVNAVCRIQRGTGNCRCACQKTSCHFRAIRQHDGDPVVATDAYGVEGLGGAGD